LQVQWRGEDVPGSPFQVAVLDTIRDLSKFLAKENSSSEEFYV
jgi:hypothetical protein